MHVNVIESRGSSFSGKIWEEVVANGDEEEEEAEEEQGEPSDIGSVCGRDSRSSVRFVSERYGRSSGC